jgi:hypothetical protein
VDLQADIDALLPVKHPTPFGSKKWQFACIEALQRLVTMASIQFVLFEPVERVKGNEKVRAAADYRDEIHPAEHPSNEFFRALLFTAPKLRALNKSAHQGRWTTTRALGCSPAST